MSNEDILKKYWGYDSFRGIQREIIESISSGQDTLGLMPTGGGKSLTFQVPALAKEGVCIVITPLVALMKDQVSHLRKKRIKAAAIYSGLSGDEVLKTLENAVFGAVKLLYISPERLSSELFMSKLRHMKVSFICVDEAHCISQWGYDFRPSYLTIANIRHKLPDIPVLALTATATTEVIRDITEKLSIGKQFQVFRMSFERKNLSYIVRYTDDKMQQLLHILSHIQGSAIVYVRSRIRSKEVAEALHASGYDATFFHAGLDTAEKDIRQKQWQKGVKRIIVATNAFGMGIDKPDVRLVIHIDCPDSIEAYFQEAGRAGRDGEKAYAVLLYSKNDEAKLRKRIEDTYPPKEYIRNVYDHLAYFYQIAVGDGYHATFEFPIDRFCRTFKHFPLPLESALKILNRAGYIEYREEEEGKARIQFILERDDLYRLKGNSTEEDNMIVALLRNYSGLFNGYQYIDETLLAQETNMTLVQVYSVLKSLSMKKILDFIPQKRVPYIKYLQRREESRHIHIPPSIYEDLKKRFTQRITHMINYASSTDSCRSRMLLSYFGEQVKNDCGICDVCLAHAPRAIRKAMRNEASEAIKQLLDDGKPHHISQLHTLPLPYTNIEKALHYLVDEEIVIDDDGYLTIHQ